MADERVLLISMPFGPMTRPAIGISLLKAELARRGIACDVRYFNLFLAQLVGPETYRELSDDIPIASLLGDWLFRDLVFPARPERDREYLEEYLPREYPMTFNAELLQLYVECRKLTGPFVRACLDAVPWNDYGVVGFTLTFQQTVASLALAQQIHRHYPSIKLVFGGANCEGEMGQELHRRFPFLDFVLSGEADQTFPRLMEAALRSRPDSSEYSQIPGLTFRAADGRSHVVPGPPALVGPLDSLPYPDYFDYAHALDRYQLRDKFNVQYLVETSRGCWWGEKHHCTFCGLNGQSMNFRSKSPERVVDELRYLADTYDAEVVWGTDNILDHRYFRTMLPLLKDRGVQLKLFFETKANIRKDQLMLMREVGLTWFQPGIESLNTHQLELMRKGCTGLQNIQLLKWVRQYGMHVTWNMLMGFPGETDDDYERLAEYCRAIPHLQPPSGAHPIRLDRFSPYFDQAGEFGLVDVRAHPSYAYVYPFSDASLSRLAYFFTFRYADGYDPLVAGQPMLEAVAQWLSRESLSVLYAICSENVLLICDTRPFASAPRRILSGWEREVYLLCDRIRSRESIGNWVTRRTPYVTAEQLSAFLAEMLDARLMLVEDEHYLSLAVLVNEQTGLPPVADQRGSLVPKTAAGVDRV
jgi:ribosomal peptide maturation radical SAM protein 1